MNVATPTVAPVVALVGNPNCGKTALFNALTGSRQKVANYPGVTVEKKIGRLAHAGRARARRSSTCPAPIRCAPARPTRRSRATSCWAGCASDVAPDLIVCVGDASNLRLALRLALELKRVGRPVMLSLNMMDIARKRGIEIDIERLSRELGVPVVQSVAVRRGGTDALLGEIDRLLDDLPAGERGRLARARCRRAARRPARGRPRAARGGRRARASATAARRRPTPCCCIRWPASSSCSPSCSSCSRRCSPGRRPLMDVIQDGFTWLGTLVEASPLPDLLKSFLKDGLISGVGSVIVFLPQIVILFFFILVLEDLGYMARAAFLMDRIMGGAGLHGRAFIPLLSSFACAIPGIMSTRVIDDRRDRLTTILVAPLMTCSARIPVYTLIIGAFIPDREVWGFVGLQGLVMFGLYATGIAGALAVSFVIKRVFWRGDAGRAVHARAARLQAAAAQEPGDRPVDARHDLPQARRHHHRSP